MIETICKRGHLEFVAQGPYGYEYVGLDVCQRRFKDGAVCASPIVNTFQVPAVESTDCGIRPGPDDSVAPGVLLEQDEEEDCQDCAYNPGLCDTHDLEPAAPVADRVRGFLLRHVALVAAAAIASLGLTIYFWATGHRLLALLV